MQRTLYRIQPLGVNRQGWPKHIKHVCTFLRALLHDVSAITESPLRFRGMRPFSAPRGRNYAELTFCRFVNRILGCRRRSHLEVRSGDFVMIVVVTDRRIVVRLSRQPWR